MTPRRWAPLASATAAWPGPVQLNLPFRDVDWTLWDDLLRRVHHPEEEVTVALVKADPATRKVVFEIA